VRVAKVFVDAGHPVLVSQATEIDMELPASPLLELRRGRLDEQGFGELFRERSIGAVIDASHPFAVELRSNVVSASRAVGVPRLRLERVARTLPEGVVLADDHEDAARKAFSIGRVVLLTTGSRTISRYVRVADELRAEVWARLAPSEESRRAMTESGIPPSRVVWTKGPFSVKETVDLLHRCRAEVLVAKDSGDAGGILERIEAAWSCGACAVVVRRPPCEEGAVADARSALEWFEKRKRAG
jgi:precorrin-6A/cobalt-precorrin-6A reductase